MKAINSAESEFNKNLKEAYGANCQEVTVMDNDTPWWNKKLERLKKKLRLFSQVIRN